MSFVNCYLPYCRQRFISCLLSVGYFCRLCLLKVHAESCPSPLLQGSGLSTIYFYLSLCLLKFRVESWPSPLLQCRGLSAMYFCRFCLLKVHAECSSLPLPLLQCTQSTLPSLLCALFSSLFIIQGFFLQGRDQSVQGAMLVCPRGGCGNTVCHLFAHLFVCISQAG
jgi:hypothetical protein